jgi:hypothetical protein
MADYTTDPCHLYRDHADIRREVQTGFGETRYNVAERAGDIRRELQAGFGQTRVDLADAKDVLNDSIRVEGGNTRAQSAAETCEVIKEGLKGDFNTRGDIKDTRYDLADRVGNSADRIVDRLQEHDNRVQDRFWTVGRDTQDLRAQVIAQQQQMVAGFLGVSKDTELFALKTQLDSKQNTQYLSDKICADGEKTRALINDLKNSDHNRMLIERNAEIVEHRHYGHHWRGQWDQSQWQNLTQQLASQTANFNSQLSEARQGMVNFGSMAGNAGQQTSTNNNVR